MSAYVVGLRGIFFVLGKVSLGVLGRNSSGFTPWNCGSSMRSSRLVVPLASSASVSGTLEEGLLDGGKRPGKRTVTGEDQDKLVDPAILADPDSYFCEYRGVNIHHKVHDPDLPAHQLLEDDEVTPHHHDLSQSLSLPPMSLLLGFGASVYSWDRVMKRLGQITGSKVLAFDRPAFELTSRVSPANSSSGSQKVGICALLRCVTDYLSYPGSLPRKLLVSIHWSSPLYVALVSSVECSQLSGVSKFPFLLQKSPERVASLILVAPAIIAPAINAPRGKKGNQLGSNYQTGNE